MKKNYLFGLLSLFTLLFAASCQEEELAGGQMGDTATVTFSVNTPTIATRAVGDGTTATKLYVAVYENLNGTTDNPNWEGPLPVSLLGTQGFAAAETFTDRVATVNLALAKNKEYSVIFWAQSDSSMFTVDWEGRELSLKTPIYANAEGYDAFWAQKTVKLTGALTETVELKRPFAQLNIGTSDKAAAEAAGIVVTQSQVVVKKVPTTFNLQTGAVSNEQDVTYTMASIEGIKNENFPAVAAGQQYLSLNYLPMAVDKSIVDIEFKYKDEQDNDAYVLNFPSVPVQRNYRTNIYGTLLTNSANYTVEIKPGFGNDGKEDAGNIVYVTTQAEFEEALKRNDENIIINLMPTQQKAATRAAGNNEFTIEVGANEDKYYLGGEDTDSITINANGCTINFVHNNTDWNYIRCVNEGAKWIINDAHLTNSKANNGPWNRHDIRFYNAVELNNVTSDKAIALLNDGKLTGVTIADMRETDDYGLWITAQGQTVELDGCTFNMIKEGDKTGRGIKIADEYVDEPALVNLTVKNTKFNTEKKAAILVTSTAGAAITLENVDLSGVKADGFNAVWVDEARAEHADKVTVNGGFCVVEGTQTENNPFLEENGTVELPAGTFVMPTAVANGVTIIGAEDGTTVLDMTGANPSGKSDLTFRNVTVNVGTQNYHGMTHSTNLVYENCVINGTLWLYSTAVFNKCTFNVEGDNYNVWTYGSTEATFNECTFNCDGKSVLVYNEGGNGSVITMNQCSFIARAAVEGKAAVEIDSSLLKEGMVYIVNLIDCTVEGFGLGSVSNEMLFNQKKGSKATIYVDGVKTVSTEAELKAAIKAANNTEFTKIALASKTFTGAFDIDGKSVELVALNKHQATIDGLVHGLGFAHVTLRGLTLTNATPAASTSARHSADYYCLGSYVTDWVIEDCIFNVSNTGNAAGKGAINIYANRDDYELYDGFDLTIKNTVFNCNGERPIRGKTNSWVEGCTFNDQHRYAIQVQGNSGLASETVKFVNNTINNPCKTSGEAFAAGVSISKSQLLEEAAFIISGNTVTGSAPTELKFVYDDHANVKITTCTLNGKQIVEGQCFAFAEADDAMEVLDEAAYTYDTNTKTFTVYSARGLAVANQKMADKSMGRDATLVLANDIDFTGYTWTPVDSHADTAFEIKEINGNYHTIRNLTVNGQAMFRRFAGSGDVTIKNITFDNAKVNSNGSINTAILTGHSYQNVLLDNVDVKNSTITGGYKVGSLIGTVYNENASTTVTATLKNCDIEGVTVKATSYDFCTTGMVAFVYEGDNDKIEFENCTIKNLKLQARPNGYASHAWIYVNDADTDDLFNSANGVTVDESTCSFEKI